MSGCFRERRFRTTHWLALEPPAEQMLELYLVLLELQEPLYDRAGASDWGERVRTGVGRPALSLASLPIPPLLGAFQRFVRELAPESTDALAAVAGELAARSARKHHEVAGDETPARVLRAFLERRDLAHLASELGCEAQALEFFPRAFIEPIAEALASRADRSDDERRENTCPQCGWPPQVGVLRDEPETKGRRLLVCSLCATWWRFPRATCPSCGETDPEKLLYHTTEAIPHLRVDECQTCRAYLKSVDLRKDGRAVPVVEDLASVELDVWSDERGLWKIQRNLLGL